MVLFVGSQTATSSGNIWRWSFSQQAMLSATQVMPVARILVKNSLIIWIPSGVYNLLDGRVTKSVKYFEAGGGSLLDPMHTIPTGNPCLPQLRMHASVGGPNCPRITGRISVPMWKFRIITALKKEMERFEELKEIKDKPSSKEISKPLPIIQIIHTILPGNPCFPQLLIQAKEGGPKPLKITGRNVGFAIFLMLLFNICIKRLDLIPKANPLPPLLYKVVHMRKPFLQKNNSPLSYFLQPPPSLPPKICHQLE